MPNEETQSLVGQKVLYNSRSCRVVADDRHTRALKKDWDIIIQDDETNTWDKVFMDDPRLQLQEVDETSKPHTQLAS